MRSWPAAGPLISISVSATFVLNGFFHPTFFESVIVRMKQLLESIYVEKYFF